MSIKHRAKSAVRRRAARASVALPAARGPEPWQHLVGRARVAEARRVLRAEHDPAGALALVQPLLDDPVLRSRVWALVAEAREKQGDQSPDAGAQRGLVEQRLHERQGTRRVVLGTQYPSRLGDPGPPDQVLPRLRTPGCRQRDGCPGGAAAYGGLRSALDAHQTSTCIRGSP